jgi:hypothetical protein
LIIFLCYVKGLNIGLGTRGVACPHFSIPAWIYFAFVFFFDECRKVYVRMGITRENGKIKYKGWLA